MNVHCPWCGEEVVLSGDLCPLCRHEVLPEHLNGTEATEEEFAEGAEVPAQRDQGAGELEERDIGHYACSKCGHQGYRVNEVAMTGAGLSKLLDIQHHHYLFVSCLGCGSVDIYDPDVLEARKRGSFSSGLDFFL
ncbi:hypothetical protein D3P08_21765 [Paenibacillus nanensis]|uniref:Nucleic acid-binding protein n=1 Tax=Paenibacillus nanensis TaxID=393251 RepID=A0A3A1UR47_9BACL|nr:zinc ribbon domain-containing protein [Paenibacillus nanensis]RIX49901.1 hypothetical protein D3P08_21765 [Paenibacillus nanensis]